MPDLFSRYIPSIVTTPTYVLTVRFVVIIVPLEVDNVKSSFLLHIFSDDSGIYIFDDIPNYDIFI